MDAHLLADMGLQGDCLRLGISWHDHNNVEHITIVQVRVLDRDKPRTLVVECGTPDVANKELRDEILVDEVYRTEG